MIIDILLVVFVGIMCIWAWDRIDHIYQSDDKKDPVGTLLVINDGDEAYLFLETDLKPDELAKYKDVIFKVETRNQQGPL